MENNTQQADLLAKIEKNRHVKYTCLNDNPLLDNIIYNRVSRCEQPVQPFCIPHLSVIEARQ